MFGSFDLKNGLSIPKVGFGTWRIPDGEEAYNAVINAVNVGYRLIDTAKVYRNEVSVGKAIKECGINRKELFVTTKLWNSDRGYDSTLYAFDESMKKLDLEYLDLYLIHWPASFHKFDNWEQINIDTWKAMIKLYKEGRIKSIGLSNFLPHHMQALMDLEVQPMVDQLEIHPGYLQKDAVEWCQNNDIVVEAWSPFGAGKMLLSEDLHKLAKKYNISVAQLCLRWVYQHNVLPLTRTTKIERMKENANILDFEISKEDMCFIDNMKYFAGSGNHPDTLED